MRVTSPKFVKKANLWCVSIFKETSGKKEFVQTQEWFESKEAAEAFIEKNRE